MLAIGLMSGTSMDAIDVALVETDGEGISPLDRSNGFASDTHSRPYTAEEKALLARAMRDAEGMNATEGREARPGCLPQAEAMVTRAHAEAVEAALTTWQRHARDVDVVGFHGQTVIHRPGEKLTVQIGDGEALASRLGIRVVYDLRAADVAEGGEGAPLVPVFHRALAREARLELPVAILNIGGVANISYIGEGDALAGFDTGPGNALLDDLMRERAGVDLDEDGRTAASGTADRAVVDWLLAHPYFDRRPPKSLDRNWFSHRMVGHLDVADAAATLAAFTAEAIGRSLAFFPGRPRRWIVGGGGALNSHLMRLIGDAVDVVPESANSVGWSTDGLEAQAFAFLAVRRLANLPITFPSTTGVAEPTIGGRIAEPR